MEDKVNQKLYTINEIAKVRPHVPTFAIRNWCKTGALKHLKAGNRYYLTLEALDSLLENGTAVN